jgi:hypothetical protein
VINDLGDAVTITTALTDASGTPTNATMALVVTKPDGTTTSPTVSNPSTGSYTAAVTADQAGVWLYKWTASGAITAVDSGQFTVTDPAPTLYVTLAELKLHLGITDTTEDSLLRKAISTASRAVERWCNNRRFYLAPTATARVYKPATELLLVDDIGTASGVVVEVGSLGSYTTLAATSYELNPTNALAINMPVTALLAISSPALWFTGGWQPRVRVTAQWGWPAIPDDISQATLIVATRLYRRKGSPEGVAGFGDMGVVRLGRVDPDVQALLRPFMVSGIA